MTMVKKAILSSAAFYLIAASSAFAGVDVQLNLGEPAPQGVVYARPYPVGYDPHHRDGDYKYWHDHYNDRGHEKPAGHFPAHEFTH